MKLHVYNYSLKSQRPLLIGNQTINERHGSVLLLADGAQIMGVGEISPLPFWSKESNEDTLAELDKTLSNKADLKVLTSRGFFADLRWHKLQRTLSPSTSWGLYNVFKGGMEPWTHTRVNALAVLDSDDGIAGLEAADGITSR